MIRMVRFAFFGLVLGFVLGCGDSKQPSNDGGAPPDSNTKPGKAPTPPPLPPPPPLPGKG
jgi:hypothetical protein